MREEESRGEKEREERGEKEGDGRERCDFAFIHVKVTFAYIFSLSY